MPRVDQIASAIELNHFAALREFAQGDQSELLVNGEMIRVSSGVPYPLLNFVARPRFDPRQVGSRIESLVQYFAARRVPYLVYLHPSASPPDLGHRLERHGLHHWGTQDGMALERLDPKVRTNHDVEVEAACEVQVLSQAAEVNAEAYHLPPGAATYMRSVMMTALYDPAVYIYLAHLHGIPAGSLTLVLKAGVAGLYGLGTLPEYRGHGVGTSLMAQAISDASALGFRVAVLQAPPSAVRLYRRLGFETYFRVEIYNGG
jgi:ribosomal protein S18 acetylase RimI-like enzyme